MAMTVDKLVRIGKMPKPVQLLGRKVWDAALIFVVAGYVVYTSIGQIAMR